MKKNNLHQNFLGEPNSRPSVHFPFSPSSISHDRTAFPRGGDQKTVIIPENEIKRALTAKPEKGEQL